MYLTADGQPVVAGGFYWDNNLDLARVTDLASFTQCNHNTGEEVAWHRYDRIAPGRESEGLTADGSRLAVRNPFTREKAADAAVRLGVKDA